MLDWTKIRYFTPKEFDDPLYPGSGDSIDSALVYKLDEMRIRAMDHDPNILCITHAKVGGAVDVSGNHDHSEDSFHLKWNGCLAVDFHFITKIPPRGQYTLFVEQMGFPGAGIYYDQQWNNKPLPIAFHVDLGKNTWKRPQRWVRRNGEYLYLLGR